MPEVATSVNNTMKKKSLSKIIYLVVLLALFVYGLISGEDTLAPVNLESGYALVDQVVDGDTIRIKTGDGKDEAIRLIGIDTPETRDPRKPVQCFGREASAKTKELLLGKKVKLEADPTQDERDKYHRLLRYVILEDGTNINQYLIEEGFAHEYTYESNPYRYQKDFLAAENRAREAGKGFWDKQSCAGVTE